MRNLHEVLREKKSAVERVRKEVEALRLVTLLLAEEGDDSGRNVPPRTGNAADGVASRQDFPVKRPVRSTEAGVDAKFAKRFSRRLRRIAGPLLGASGN